MHFDLNSEARKLKADGVTCKQIRYELNQRAVPQTELRYFGKTSADDVSEEATSLSKYSTSVLLKLEELMMEDAALLDDIPVVKEKASFSSLRGGEACFLKGENDMKAQDTKIVTGIFDSVKERLSSNIYEEIKAQLDACETLEECREAYKWLAGQFAEANESAKHFEKKVVEKYGEEEFGILMYGSKEAYERELEFEERMNKAESHEERQAIIFEKLMSEPLGEEEYSVPELWPEEDKEDDDYPQAL